MPTLEASVRDQISLYVGGYISADELNDALPDTFDIDEADEQDGTELVMLVIGYLAEYQAEDRTEEGLRAALVGHASWSSEQSFTTFTTQPGVEAEIRVGARTPLQVVYG